ncbi:MAG: amidohydrolase [Chloroflexi bacterium]|nr:amidohydrolase [Chloroflexota bacterium]|tara:strand:- start:101 stop:1021 length:921 start_codon:yes stop_codon:yes gene_type:complete
MIIDVHTHLPTHPDKVPPYEVKTEQTMRSGEVVTLTNTIEDYIRDMAPLDKAFLFGIAPRPWIKRIPGTGIGQFKSGSDFGAGIGWDNSLNHNDVASITAKRAPDKIIPFMSLHPNDPGWRDEYDRCVGDLGCKGIKLGPNYQDFDPTGTEAFKMFSRLESDGIPIVFHQGTSPMSDAPLTYAHPLTTDKVAMAFPDLKIILAHLAHPWQTDCITVVRKHPNVWADVSAQFYRPYSFWQAMRLFYEWGCTEKILFGSDWPVTKPQHNIDHLRLLPKFAKDHQLPTIPESDIEGIINRDALDILGVD